MLAEHKQLLDNMARLLVEKETIFSEEVDMLMEGKSLEEIEKFMDENEKILQENPFARGNRTIVKEPEAKEESAQAEKTEDAPSGNEPKDEDGGKTEQ